MHGRLLCESPCTPCRKGYLFIRCSVSEFIDRYGLYPGDILRGTPLLAEISGRLSLDIRV